MKFGRSGFESWNRHVRLVSLGAFLSLAGCHSAFIQASIINHSGEPVRLVEADYPSASFGTGELVKGATFKYRFKVLGSGMITLTWTDSRGRERTSRGPALQEGQEGSLSVILDPTGAHWVQDMSTTK